ncbi:hypothetical protein FHS96_001282 [Sphingomonas zeicaulis]
MKIDHIAWDMKRSDLACAVCRLRETADKAIGDKASVRGTIAEPNEIAVRAHLDQIARQCQHGISFSAIEVGSHRKAIQPALQSFLGLHFERPLPSVSPSNTTRAGA